MGDCFHGWQRKLGLLTPLMALVFMGQWVISLQHCDFVIVNGRHTQFILGSVSGGLFLDKRNVEDSETAGAMPKPTGDFLELECKGVNNLAIIDQSHWVSRKVQDSIARRSIVLGEAYVVVRRDMFRKPTIVGTGIVAAGEKAVVPANDDANTPDGTALQDAMDNHDLVRSEATVIWRWPDCGFGVCDFGHGNWFVCIPYWSIVIPVTLVSFWLLFSKPRSSNLKNTAELVPEKVL